jgi:hypothetical protein
MNSCKKTRSRQPQNKKTKYCNANKTSQGHPACSELDYKYKVDTVGPMNS